MAFRTTFFSLWHRPDKQASEHSSRGRVIVIGSRPEKEQFSVLWGTDLSQWSIPDMATDSHSHRMRVHKKHPDLARTFKGWLEMLRSKKRFVLRWAFRQKGSVMYRVIERLDLVYSDTHRSSSHIRRRSCLCCWQWIYDLFFLCRSVEMVRSSLDIDEDTENVTSCSLSINKYFLFHNFQEWEIDRRMWNVTCQIWQLKCYRKCNIFSHQELCRML